ncbi:hypothetical protein MCAMS1_02870 [biofilm metagenome]
MIKTKRQGEGNRKLERLMASGVLEQIELSLVDRDENQPRTRENVLRNIPELADNIKEHGLLKPPLYQICDNGRYKIVNGERRTEAYRFNGETEIPAITKRFTAEEEELVRKIIYESQYIDNDEDLQQSLTPIEQAQYWHKYVNNFHSGNLASAAKAMGKSVSFISQKLTLLEASGKVKEFIEKKMTDTLAAYELVTLDQDNPNAAKEMMSMYQKASQEGTGFSVRKFLEEAKRDTQNQKKHVRQHKLKSGVSVDDIMKRAKEGDASGKLIGAAFVSGILDKPLGVSLRAVESMTANELKTFNAIIDLIRLEKDKEKFETVAKEIESESRRKKTDKPAQQGASKQKRK